MPSLLGITASGKSNTVPFVPSDIAGLIGWWDATDAGSITDAGGGKVSQWDDLSTSGIGDLVQATDGDRPLTGNATINSLNTLSFVSVDRLTKALDGGLAQPFTIAYAARFNVTNANQIVAANTNGNVAIGIWNSSGRKGFMFAGGDFPNASAWVADTSPHTTVGVFDGNTNSVFRVDGTTYTDGNPGTVGFAAFATFTVGYSSQTTNFDLGEILVYNSGLTGNDLTDVEDYLAAKWGTP